ncbi:ABC transporter substrate-binding protein [Brucella anthropi]|uniref:ABC transporter substrate-binding protein n=1 Tax=Brucella anthropi TaxID=529 RepID=UPI00044C4F89|nr:extracellular solute-binding protein [Brucella anthropi]EXL02606.1 ABC transporter substrate-binding protein [Brucella anthropi]
MSIYIPGHKRMAAGLSGMTRRNFLGTAAVVGASVAAPAVRAQSGVTLRFLNQETSVASQAALKKACDEYESKFGVRIIVDSTPISGTTQKAMAAINAGQSYDIMTAGFIASILQFVQAGVLLPVTDLVKKYDWGKGAAWEYEGENWYYPFDYNLVVNYYRKDLYAQKGLKVPETSGDFLKNCEALTVNNSGNVDVGGCVIPLASDSATNWASFGNMFAEGTQLFDKDWNVVLDQGENLDRATRFLDLYGELYKTMPPGMNAVGYAQLMSLFTTGKAAHTLYSGRLVESLEATNPALADQYGIFASPSSSGQKALSYAFDGFCVFKTKQSEEAVKFLQWFADEHYVDWLLSAWMNNHPSRLDIYENERWKSHPMIKKHWETMMQMKSFIAGDGVTITAIDTSGPSIDMRACNVFNANVMPEMLQQKVLGNTSSADCVAAAAQRIRSLI